MKKTITILFVLFLLVASSCSKNAYQPYYSRYSQGKNMIMPKSNQSCGCNTYRDMWDNQWREKNNKVYNSKR